MLEIAWNLTEPVQTMMRVTEEERVQMQGDHEQMLEAFVSRDAERLTSLAETHHARLTACIARIGAR